MKSISCRFCAHAQICGYTGLLECDIDEETKTYEEGTKIRDCENYVLVDCDPEYMDFYMEIDYVEKKPTEKPVAKNQISLFDDDEVKYGG